MVVLDLVQLKVERFKQLLQYIIFKSHHESRHLSLGQGSILGQQMN